MLGTHIMHGLARTASTATEKRTLSEDVEQTNGQKYWRVYELQCHTSAEM